MFFCEICPSNGAPTWSHFSCILKNVDVGYCGKLSVVRERGLAAVSAGVKNKFFQLVMLNMSETRLVRLTNFLDLTWWPDWHKNFALKTGQIVRLEPDLWIFSFHKNFQFFCARCLPSTFARTDFTKNTCVLLGALHRPRIVQNSKSIQSILRGSLDQMRGVSISIYWMSHGDAERKSGLYSGTW